MKSVALHNLGCKVNFYEMDVMQQYLQKNGYKIVEFNQKADLYIINTCTVTNIADRKSRQMLHKAKKMNPDAIVVAVGCYVQTGEAEVEKDPCIDLAIGNNRKKDLVKIVDAFLKQREEQKEQQQDALERIEAVQKTLDHTTIIDINHTDEYEEMQLMHTGEHTRAYIKIQDGCNQFCSYCVIPYARGRVRSRKPENVINEIKGLAGNGYKEIVLTGIHLSSYGLDFHGISYNSNRQEFDPKSEDLIELIEQIQQIEGITRIRLGSLEPRIVTNEFASRLSKLDKICPHFHLSLQSGCDSVLKRMNRQYSSQQFLESVQILRQYFKDPAITTDVITGFPGETEDEFKQTVQFLEQVRFFEMHIFPYSIREGTVAAGLGGQLTEKQKKERSAVLLEMDAKDSLWYRKQHIGQVMEVLFEQQLEVNGKKYETGHTRNYMKVAIEATDDVKEQKQDLSNQEMICSITGMLSDEILLGEIKEV